MLDERGMLIITAETLESLENRLLDPQQVPECREEIERMLQIKETLLWRADAGSSCVGRAMSANLFGEVRLLEAALQALDEGDAPGAASLMKEFSLLAKSNGTL
jgi:hypothetical protein